MRSGARATIRCPFCLALNRVDISRAEARPRCGKCEKPILLDRPIRVEPDDFRRTVLEAEVPVLVDFYADWCGPCKVIAPVLDEIAAREQGRLLVVKVDADRAGELASRHGVRGIPTLLRFEDGREVGRAVGADTDAVLGLARSSARAS